MGATALRSRRCSRSIGLRASARARHPVLPLDPAQDESEDEGDLDSGAELTGVLAQRLEQLRDPSWLKPVVESAFARMTGTSPAVEGLQIEYCKIKPNRDINVALKVLLDGGGTPG